jgi:putative alpha-1,2-mannosidase
MFNPAQTSVINGTDTGFVGFLQPRFLNGTFGVQDPIYCSPLLNFTACYLNAEGGETYEGPVWLYTFFVPGDMASLIHTLGGTETFIKRLDWLHESGILYVGDEQAFLNLFLYHYAGRPGKSAERAHQYIPSLFNDTIAGIPGNDDSGAMGSFEALVMMGLYPNAGQVSPPSQSSPFEKGESADKDRMCISLPRPSSRRSASRTNKPTKQPRSGTSTSTRSTRIYISKARL